MKLPDRIRLSPYARLTVLRAIRSYVKTLLETKDSERDNWPEAMDAWKIGKSLALRPKGRREQWGVDWFYNFDKVKPVADIDQWIQELINWIKAPTQGLKIGDVVTGTQIVPPAALEELSSARTTSP